MDAPRYSLNTHNDPILATFSDVPAGVAIFVTVAPVRSSSSRFVDAVLVGADENGASKGETRAVTPTSPAVEGIAPVAITNGTGQAVWEITRADFDAIDTVVFGITVAYLRDVPELVTASVDGRFAPLAAAQSQGKLIPLFAGDAARERAFEISLGDACSVAARDVVLGSLTDPLRDDVFAFDALTGTLLDLDVRAKGGTTPVEVRLFDPSLEPIDIGPFLRARGRSTRLKRFPLFATGQYQVVLRSADGAPTGYRLQVIGKLPREKLKLKAVAELRTPGEKLTNSFEAVGGSILNVILRGKGTDPEILELVGPSGSPAESGEVVLALGSSLLSGLKTERVKNFLLPLTGVYRLGFTGKGSAGILNLSIRVKGPNRRVLAECAE